MNVMNLCVILHGAIMLIVILKYMIVQVFTMLNIPLMIVTVPNVILPNVVLESIVVQLKKLSQVMMGFCI